MPIWLPLGLKILAKKAIGVNEKLKNSKIFYVARCPPLNLDVQKDSEKACVEKAAAEERECPKEKIESPIFENGNHLCHAKYHDLTVQITDNPFDNRFIKVIFSKLYYLISVTNLLAANCPCKSKGAILDTH